MEKISDERLISIRNDGESGGTFADADVLSMIGEIIYSRKRIAELLNAYRKLEADARISQEFQTDVLAPLFDQLERAGYAGTWSQKVAAVLNPWIAVSERLPELYSELASDYVDVLYRYVDENGVAYGKCYYVKSVQYPMPLPLPPESEGK